MPVMEMLWLYFSLSRPLKSSGLGLCQFEKAVNFGPISFSQRYCLIHNAFTELKEANEVSPFIKLRLNNATFREAVVDKSPPRCAFRSNNLSN